MLANVQVSPYLLSPIYIYKKWVSDRVVRLPEGRSINLISQDGQLTAGRDGDLIGLNGLNGESSYDVISL